MKILIKYFGSFRSHLGCVGGLFPKSYQVWSWQICRMLQDCVFQGFDSPFLYQSISWLVCIRLLQQFPFDFPNSGIDFPGIPENPSSLIPPSLINFDCTSCYRSLTFNHMNVMNDSQQLCMLSDVCFILLVCFCRFLWHLIYIFSVFPHKICLTGNYFLEITSRIISRNPATRELLQLTCLHSLAILNPGVFGEHVGCFVWTHFSPENLFII